MKITETTQRECCQPKDMKPYGGLLANDYKECRKWYKFCVHCGQVQYSIPDKEPGDGQIRYGVVLFN